MIFRYLIALVCFLLFTLCSLQNVKTQTLIIPAPACPSCQHAVLSWLSEADSCKQTIIVMLGHKKAILHGLLLQTGTRDFKHSFVGNPSDWFRYIRPENIYVVDDRQDPPVLFAFPPGEAQAIVNKLSELIDCKQRE